jgi:hypothetical protein
VFQKVWIGHIFVALVGVLCCYRLGQSQAPVACNTQTCTEWTAFKFKAGGRTETKAYNAVCCGAGGNSGYWQPVWTADDNKHGAKGGQCETDSEGIQVTTVNVTVTDGCNPAKLPEIGSYTGGTAGVQLTRKVCSGCGN